MRVAWKPGGIEGVQNRLGLGRCDPVRPMPSADDQLRPDDMSPALRDLYRPRYTATSRRSRERRCGTGVPIEVDTQGAALTARRPVGESAGRGSAGRHLRSADSSQETDPGANGDNHSSLAARRLHAKQDPDAGVAALLVGGVLEQDLYSLGGEALGARLSAEGSARSPRSSARAGRRRPSTSTGISRATRRSMAPASIRRSCPARCTRR